MKKDLHNDHPLTGGSRRYIERTVECGRFATADEVVAEALRLLLMTGDEGPVTKPPPPADELNRGLLEAGLLSPIPNRPDPATYEEFTPVVIEGEPLSETIIRERR